MSTAAPSAASATPARPEPVQHGLRDDSGRALDDQRRVGQQPARVSPPLATVSRAHQPERAARGAGEPGAQLERRPVVGARAEGHDHRTLARAAGCAHVERDVARRPLEHARRLAAERSVTRVHQHQVHALLGGEARDVLAGGGRRERRRARREPVPEELVPKRGEPGRGGRRARPRPPTLATISSRPGSPAASGFATVSSPSVPSSALGATSTARAGSGAAATGAGAAALRGGRRQRQLGVLAQDRRLELLQRLARLEPEPVRQLAPRTLIGVERIGLAVAPVEREHQLVPEALAERVCATSVSSSATSSACRPSARSASIRCSIAASRISSSRAISGCANSSYARSASGAPRHSASASLSLSPPAQGGRARLGHELLEAGRSTLRTRRTARSPAPA